MSPPRLRTMVRTCASPIPSPGWLCAPERRNSSNTRSWSDAAMPRPLSDTAISIRLPATFETAAPVNSELPWHSEQPSGPKKSFIPSNCSAVSALQDRSVTAESVFGKEGGALAAELVRLDRWALEEDGRDSAADEQMMDLLDRFLLARVPNPDPRAELAITIAGAIATDQSLLRVEQVAARYGLTVRGLQRLFSEYVGTTPKWVIKRYRMHEAIERLQEGSPEAWTRFALELGYFDQAHFIREFRAITGRSPGKYAATRTT